MTTQPHALLLKGVIPQIRERKRLRQRERGRREEREKGGESRTVNSMGRVVPMRTQLTFPSLSL